MGLSLVLPWDPPQAQVVAQHHQSHQLVPEVGHEGRAQHAAVQVEQGTHPAVRDQARGGGSRGLKVRGGRRPLPVSAMTRPEPLHQPEGGEVQQPGSSTVSELRGQLQHLGEDPDGDLDLDPGPGVGGSGVEAVPKVGPLSSER